MLLSCALFVLQVGVSAPIERDRWVHPTQFHLKSLLWDTQEPLPSVPSALAWSRAEALDAGYWFVQTQPGQYQATRKWVQDGGGQAFDYLPHNGFEARLTSAQVALMHGAVQALVPVHPAWKVSPRLGQYQTNHEDAAGRLLLAVEFWPDRDLEHEEMLLMESGADVLETHASGRYLRALVLMPLHRVPHILRLSGVKWVEESAPAVFRNDDARWILQTNQPNWMRLWGKGLTGAGVTVGHIDGRVYENSCYFNDPSGASPGPNHRKIKWMSSGFGSDSHGTHTAGTAVGDSRPYGSSSGSGMAPDAWLVHETDLPNSTNLLAKLDNAHSYGARIHTNSWGNDYTTDYDNWTRDIDAYSHDNEDGLVLFAVTNRTNIKNPENAKSSLSVGATELNNPDLHASGGMGPTADGRIKPEVMAPGCSLTSAAAGANCLTMSLCGTSMAAPVIAGGSALIKQYFEDGFYASGRANPASGFTPSGSLLRACMANSGVDLVSEPGYPSWREGWGRPLLDDVIYLKGDVRQLRVVDIPHAQGVSHHQTRSRKMDIPVGAGDLRITMAFADEPGSAFASLPVVNDLSLLVVDPNGVRYSGNILNTFSGTSFPGTVSKDHLNTLETVLVPNPVPGKWTVRVEGTDVLVGPQGFAVVATF